MAVERIFVTGLGVDLADKLQPLIEANIPPSYSSIDALNGFGLLLTRRLGSLERIGEPLLKQWIREYCTFVLTRFAALSDETD